MTRDVISPRMASLEKTGPKCTTSECMERRLTVSSFVYILDRFLHSNQKLFQAIHRLDLLYPRVRSRMVERFEHDYGQIHTVTTKGNSYPWVSGSQYIKCTDGDKPSLSARSTSFCTSFSHSWIFLNSSPESERTLFTIRAILELVPRIQFSFSFLGGHIPVVFKLNCRLAEQRKFNIAM